MFGAAQTLRHETRDADDSLAMKPRVLLAHSHLWPNVCRLAIAFRSAGFAVEAIAPSRSPIHKMHSPDRTFFYRQTSARSSLRSAINASRPQLIIPCDDRVVAHLYELHDESSRLSDGSDAFSIRALIETSLGAPKSYELLRSRRMLGRLSELPGVHIPRNPDPASENVGQPSRAWASANGLPAVLKLDGSWGGRDVIVIPRSAAIGAGFLKMQLHRSVLRRLSRALTSRDVEPLVAYLSSHAWPGSLFSHLSRRSTRPLRDCLLARSGTCHSRRRGGALPDDVRHGDCGAPR